jgi:hypothetical protein
MKYNLAGTSNELRTEICSLQKDITAIRDCNTQLKTEMSNDAATGFAIAFFVVLIWVIGFCMGKTM